MALRSYSFFRHFTVFHYHHYSRLVAGTEHINVCRVSCGGVSNMLLVLSTTFYFHYNIRGCMYSTGQFMYRWLKGYIYSSCYYHHQIRSIHLSHCFHIFSWLCAWYVYIILHHILSLIVYTFQENQEFVFISIVQFMMSANSQICFGLQIVFICLYITPSDYHHCANFIWRHWTYKMPVRYSLSSVWVRLSIFSQLSIIQYMGLCAFSLPISFVMIERIYILCLIIIIKSEVWTIFHCLVLGHETMVCAVCLSIFSRGPPGSCWPPGGPHVGPMNLAIRAGMGK